MLTTAVKLHNPQNLIIRSAELGSSEGVVDGQVS